VYSARLLYIAKQRFSLPLLRQSTKDSNNMAKAQEEFESAPAADNMQHNAQTSAQDEAHKPRRTFLSRVYLFTAVFLLFLNFFLAQYDKFVLSYFQAEVKRSLNLSSADYGVLSGYATGIVYAVLALPIAFVADYVQARVWVLSVAALWWSLCVLFQGLSRSFWQILLARIGMGIGQAPVEALSISLISDLVDAKWLFLAERYVFIFRPGDCGNSSLLAVACSMSVFMLARQSVGRLPPRSTKQGLLGMMRCELLAL
jgi:Na+/melibiose symporter-like transporter